MRKTVFAFLLVAVFVVAPARAQVSGSVRAVSGVSKTNEFAAVLGGGFQIDLGQGVSVLGEVGWMQDVMPQRTFDDLEEFAKVLSRARGGARVRIDPDIRVVYGTLGLRLQQETSRMVAPFIEANVGVGRAKPAIKADAGGADVSGAVLTALAFGSQTKALAGVGGGIRIAPGGSVHADLGYRYRRLFTDPGLNVNEIFSAIGWRF